MKKVIVFVLGTLLTLMMIMTLLCIKTPLFIFLEYDKDEIIELNEKYIKKSAKTLLDKTIKEKGIVDVSKVGKYKVKYCYRNNCKYRDIYVVDKTDPTIQLIGNQEINIVKGEEYIEPGYVGEDNYDGNITNNVKIESNLDTAVPGIYEIRYKLEDSSKNKVMSKRMINVNEFGPTSMSVKDFSLNGYFTNTIIEETEADDKYLNETIFFGDSITVNFAYYKNISFDNIWAASNVTPANALTWKVMFYKYKKEVNIIDGFREYKPKRVIITLGTNAIAIMERSYFITKYEELIIKLKEASPTTQIIVQSVTPVAYYLDNYQNSLNNTAINNANYLIAQMCERQKIKFLNTAEALKNENGTALDGYFYYNEGIHLLPKANDIVMNYVKTHCIE